MFRGLLAAAIFISMVGYSSCADLNNEVTEEKMKCYSCDSTQDECDKEHAGETVECGVEFGCTINKDSKLFTRGCSVDAPGCSQDGDTRNCNCKTEFCNLNWTSAGAEETIKCYSCDTDDNNGKCDNEYAGEEMDCPWEDGCIISTDTHDGKTVFIRGCAVPDDEIKCIHEGVTGQDTTTCRCLGALCNLDWSSAGSTTANAETTHTTPDVPKMKCYQCDSLTGDCSEEAPGQEVDCPETFGCTISKTITSDGTEGLVRDCSSEKDILCDTIENGGDVGGTTQFCNCNTALCNFDWTSAGSTTSAAATTTTTATKVTLASAVTVLIATTLIRIL